MFESDEYLLHVFKRDGAAEWALSNDSILKANLS